MPSLKAIKRRIVSVKSTQKITRAMKLVSSAKYVRANTRVLRARPFRDSLDELVGRLYFAGEGKDLPYFQDRPEERILVLGFFTNRGLCGGLNANLARRLQGFLQNHKQKGTSIDFLLMGKRSDLITPQKYGRVLERHDRTEKDLFAFAESLAQKIRTPFEKNVYDRVYCAFPRFQNAMSQVPELELLLPFQPVEAEAAKSEKMGHGFLFEPNPRAVLEDLLRRRVTNKIYGILLEAAASEHAARMTAMDNATNNADEVIRSLTLTYNRVRQAAITKELIEITSGAEAL